MGVKVVEESDVDVGSDHRMLIAPEVSTGLAKAVKDQENGGMEPKRKKGWKRKSVGKVFASLVNVRLMAHCEEGDMSKQDSGKDGRVRIKSLY